MALILSLDTSTKACSVALHNKGELVASRNLLEDKSHSVKLMALIDEVMEESGQALEDLSAIAVSKGPGSYTGLRIGVSTAKGLCYALGIPLLSEVSLILMANQVRNNVTKESLLCPMIDARRMEVYCALYNTGMDVVEEVNAKIIDETSFSMELDKGPVYFFGDGSGKCKEVLGNHSNANFVENIHPSAQWMGESIYKKFVAQEFEDVAYFEPFYLKDFIATTPRKLI